MWNRWKRAIVGRPQKSRTMRPVANLPDLAVVPALPVGDPRGLGAVDLAVMSDYLCRHVVRVEGVQTNSSTANQEVQQPHEPGHPHGAAQNLPAQLVAEDNGLADNRVIGNRVVDNGSSNTQPAPDRAAHEGAAPDGAAPDGAAPDGAAPDGPAPDGAASSGTARWRILFEDGTRAELKLQTVGRASSEFPALQARFLAQQDGVGRDSDTDHIAIDATGRVSGAPYEMYYRGTVLAACGTRHEAVVVGSGLDSAHSRGALAGIAVLALRMLDE